jgi:hypothetical protein
MDLQRCFALVYIFLPVFIVEFFPVYLWWWAKTDTITADVFYEAVDELSLKDPMTFRRTTTTFQDHKWLLSIFGDFDKVTPKSQFEFEGYTYTYI